MLGNLTTVVEPDPANQPSGTLTTTYTYDWMNHVSQVSMTRSSTTQTRTFVYSDAGLLTSATNPESGAAAYTYNADNTLWYKHDAKGQDTVYSYDAQKRVTMAQRYPTGRNNAEDLCQRVTYSYDTNPYNSGFSQNSLKRLTAAAYGPVNGSGQSCIPGVAPTSYVEMYSYHPAGAVTAKRLRATRNSVASNLDVTYEYDSAGRTHATTYPMAAPFGSTSYPTGPMTFYYGLDGMGRPASLSDYHGWTWVQNVQYDYAGRTTSLQYLVGSGVYSTQTMSFNANSQLNSLNWSTPAGYGPTGGIQYAYSATQNNGQIAQASDTLSGETIVYGYDLLKRLTAAASSPIAGGTPAAWTEGFQYDGFGNLTAKVLNGTTSPIAVDATTNRLAAGTAGYDLSGNMTSGLTPLGVGVTYTYDVGNRLSSAAIVSGGAEYYAYAPDNKRIYKLKADGVTEEWTFFGARGEKLGVYSLGSGGFTPLRSNVSFGGKPILDSNNAVFPDRLGTNRAGGARFYPYGEEITATSNDREKFGTYARDGYTGLDYADQRFYASTYGRFNTPDPYQATPTSPSDPGNPGSWNRYAYVIGDPVNFSDPNGTCGGPSISGTRPDGTMYISVAIPCTANDALLGLPYQPVAPHPAFQPTVKDYDDLHPTPALERAQCLRELSGEFKAVKKAVDDKIHEEFKPLGNVSSLSIKEAIYMGYKAAAGDLLTEMGVAEAIDTTIGGVVFSSGVGAIIGATAAVITLPLNPYIEQAVRGFVNSTLDVIQANIKPDCDPGPKP